MRLSSSIITLNIITASLSLMIAIMSGATMHEFLWFGIVAFMALGGICAQLTIRAIDPTGAR